MLSVTRGLLQFVGRSQNDACARHLLHHFFFIDFEFEFELNEVTHIFVVPCMGISDSRTRFKGVRKSFACAGVRLPFSFKHVVAVLAQALFTLSCFFLLNNATSKGFLLLHEAQIGIIRNAYLGHFLRIFL